MSKTAVLNNGREIALNYLSAASLLVGGYFFYVYHPYFADFFSNDARELFGYCVLAYLILLPFYYTTLPPGYAAKSRLFWVAVQVCFRRPLQREEKTAVLAVLVKLFFLPLMVAWLFSHATQTVFHLDALIHQGNLFPNGYWLLFNIIFLIDVGCFTVGYAVEHPRLGNEIRSVEPTATGWIVTLICYPPFNGATQQMLGWHASDYPAFSDAALQIVAAVAILSALSIYAWASVALNLKASNLTHRGIVGTGPYRWIRHPAYAAKNLAWWVGSLPILYGYAQRDVVDLAYGVIGVIGWTVIYYFRAVTEERHLGMDPAYQNYCAKVRYKFIPGVW